MIGTMIMLNQILIKLLKTKSSNIAIKFVGKKSQPDASETNADVNFFADMEPDNIAQAKIYVGSPKSGQLSERNNIQIIMIRCFKIGVKMLTTKTLQDGMQKKKI